MFKFNNINFSNISLISGVGNFSKINNQSSCGAYPPPQELGAISVMDFAKIYSDGDYADGDTITTVADKSGNGCDATAASYRTPIFDEGAFGTVGATGYTTTAVSWPNTSFSTPGSTSKEA